jgi:hypothetical protein
MSFHTEEHTITVTGGTGQTVTNHRLRGLLWQVIIKPDSDATVWSMEIREDKTNREILGWDSETGSVNSAFGLEVPMQVDRYKLLITASDTDEDFLFRITVREPVYGQ